MKLNPEHYLQTIGVFGRSKISRDIAKLASGIALAHSLTFAFAPVVTRLFGPEAFGQFGIFSAIVSLLAPLAALSYPIAIILPKDDRDALQLVRISIHLSLLTAILTGALIFLGKEYLNKYSAGSDISDLALLVSVAMLFSVWSQTGEHWLIRKSQFNIIACSAIVQSAISNSAKVLIGLFHPVAGVLIWIAALSPAIYAVLLAIGALRRYGQSADIDKNSAQSSLQTMATRHIDFPLYRTPQIFINALSQAVPVLLFGVFFGATAAGFYALSRGVMALPSTFLGKAVNNVFYPRINAAAQSENCIYELIFKGTLSLFLIGLIPFGIVVVYGPWLFEFIFGDEWRIAGEYSQWLSLYFIMHFINKPCIAAVPVLEAQRGFLVYEIVSTGVILLSLALVVYVKDDPLSAVAIFSATGAVSYGYLILWVFGVSKKWDSRIAAAKYKSA